MSDTPKCDALVRDPLDSNDTSSWHSLAYHLERDNARLQARVEELRRENEGLRAGIKVAKQFYEVAIDWNFDRAEIDGEMRQTRELRDDAAALLAARNTPTGEQG